jgi:hypothetical protein
MVRGGRVEPEQGVEPMWTLPELAAAAHLSVDTLRHWAQNGWLPTRRIGGRHRVPESVVRQVLAGEPGGRGEGT